MNGDRHLLTNGRYRTLVTAAGAGHASLGQLDLTRWLDDPTREADGIFAYLRDLDTGAFWSTGFQPVPVPGMTYAVSVTPAALTIERRDGTLAVRTEITVAPHHDVERRRVTIRNHGSDARRIELTTYAEVVLNLAGADAGHPAFSKLFVQTAWSAEHEIVLAHRRPRSPEDNTLTFGHALRWRQPGLALEPLQCETDRARFVGRGHGLRDPCALTDAAILSGTVGDVLDPIASLRRACTIAPGGMVVLDALFAAGVDRQEVEGAIAAADHEETFARRLEEATVSAVALRTPEVPLPTMARPVSALPAPADRTEMLQFDNGHGGFSADGSEYVIRLDRTATAVRLPPLPWTNVIANPAAGCVVSETGLGFTWATNSRENRLTPWFNDPVSDPVGEALYLRDDDAREFWSPTPAPVPGDGAYTCRHGFGYTRWTHESRALVQDVVCFMAREAPVKLVRLRVTNQGQGTRALSLFYYAEWVLGSLRQTSGASIVTESVANDRVLLAQNGARPDFAAATAFVAVRGPAEGGLTFTADRLAFLGSCGSPASPAAVAGALELDGRTGAGMDPCAGFHLRTTLAPGESAEWTVLLGEAPSRDEAVSLAARFDSAAAVTDELASVVAGWRELLGAIQVTTPVPALDLMVNGWLGYQNLCCRIWARSAMYQSGGAFGYRDQLQDAAALVYHRPELTRSQILLHAAHQFVEGDVLHWWHPPAGRGIRTRFADDLLWLPLLTQFYADTTGDQSVFDERTGFLTARLLRDGEDEVFLMPHDSGTAGTVYEHCCRAIDRSLATGAHGLPLIGTGDWNDGMNRVGRLGRGESVWMGFFLHTILERFLPTCRARGDDDRALRYQTHMASLRTALNAGGWDGAWFRRAYYDDGTPLGSATSDECRIDAIAQAWSVISGVASPERAASALDAMEEYLVDEPAGLIRLLTPPFDRTPHDPGYIKGYLPGVRENGGQYTHAALWAIKALAEAGRSEQAARLLEMVSPVTRGGSADAIATYLVEPYVIAADVYGESPHTGRGGWTWYTGSAGWMLRVALESVLGITLRAGRILQLRPALPLSWPGFSFRYCLPEDRGVVTLDVRRVKGAAAVRSTTLSTTLDAEGVQISLPVDGGDHQVVIEFGDNDEVAYRPSAAPAVRMTSA